MRSGIRWVEQLLGREERVYVQFLGHDVGIVDFDAFAGVHAVGLFQVAGMRPKN